MITIPTIADKVTRKWIIENGIGHWEVMYKGMTVSCDDGELSEVIRELTYGKENE